MAYQTGVSSTVADLLDTLRTFAVASGFANGPSWVSGGYNLFSLSKAGTHYVFSYNSSELFINTATSVTGSGAAVGQPGACSVNCRVWPIGGPHVAYHFFSDGDAIHVVVELVTNVFQHFSFGMIAKAGSWVGGGYVSGNNWSDYRGYPYTYLDGWDGYRHQRLFDSMNNYGDSNKGHVRVDFSAGYPTSVFLQGTGIVAGSSVAKCSPWDFAYELLTDSPNAFNTRTALLPVQMYVSSQPQDFTPEHWLELGNIPTAASVSMVNLNPRETINTDWMVFPLCQKNGDGTRYVNTGVVGMAYRK